MNSARWNQTATRFATLAYATKFDQRRAVVATSDFSTHVATPPSQAPIWVSFGNEGFAQDGRTREAVDRFRRKLSSASAVERGFGTSVGVSGELGRAAFTWAVLIEAPSREPLRLLLEEAWGETLEGELARNWRRSTVAQLQHTLAADDDDVIPAALMPICAEQRIPEGWPRCGCSLVDRGSTLEAELSDGTRIGVTIASQVQPLYDEDLIHHPVTEAHFYGALIADTTGGGCILVEHMDDGERVLWFEDRSQLARFLWSECTAWSAVLLRREGLIRAP